MEQYIEYLRKSRFDRDYLDLSVEETLKRHQEILDRLARDRGFYIAKVYREVVSGESIAARPEVQKMLEEVSSGIYTGVLVVDVERLARGNSADQAYISQIFQFSDTKIITPAKTKESVESILLFLATMIANITATKPKEKEERVIIKYPPPSNIARAAPNPAPVEAPNRSGDTIGLRKIPW